MHKNLRNYKFQKRSLSNNRWTGGILSWYHTGTRLMDQFLNRAFVLYLSTRRTYINMSQSTIHTHILDLRAFYHHNIHIWMNVSRATRGSVSCPRHADWTAQELNDQPFDRDNRWAALPPEPAANYLNPDSSIGFPDGEAWFVAPENTSSRL